MCTIPTGGRLNEEITAEAAIQKARDVIKTRYGTEAVASAEPFSASLSSGVWTVRGHVPEGNIGGSYVARISAHTGCAIGAFAEQ